MIRKKRTTIYLAGILILNFLCIHSTEAQIADDGFYKSRSGIQGWSLAATGGSNLFYGDLRQYDYYPVIQNNNEWRAAFSGILHKDISKVFGLQLRYINGKLAGTKRSVSRYFNADISEYSMEGTINFTHLFMPNKPYKRIEMYGSAGMGLSDWETTKYDLATDEIVGGNGHSGNGYNQRTTELVLPLAIGFDINLSSHWALNLENSWRIVNSDILDATVGNFEYDMYGFTSLGLRYNFTGSGRSRSQKRYAYTGEKIYEYVSEQDQIREEQKQYITPKRTENDECIDTDLKEYNYTNEYQTSGSQIELETYIPNQINVGDILEINIRIDKGTYNKSASLRQTLPYGVKLLDAEVKGGKVTTNRQMISIFWLNLPQEESFTITYTLGTSEVNAGVYPLNGIFTYTELGTPRQINFKNQVQLNESFSKTFEDDFLEKPETNYKEVIVHDVDQYNNRPSAIITEGVEFRIQIRAKYGSKISIGAIKARYNITEPVYEDYYKGYYIYTIGSFTNYEDAQRKKAEIKMYYVSDSFIVAFRNGHRLESITEIIK
ncbi:MAG: hypothetical protein JEZ03_05785 [Bacteroidales bacterium]|nr:hypothetical protein [Bacteroidales bacterium]